jgi:hypothetical protein
MYGLDAAGRLGAMGISVSMNGLDTSRRTGGGALGRDVSMNGLDTSRRTGGGALGRDVSMNGLESSRRIGARDVLPGWFTICAFSMPIGMCDTSVPTDISDTSVPIDVGVLKEPGAAATSLGGSMLVNENRETSLADGFGGVPRRRGGLGDR